MIGQCQNLDQFYGSQQALFGVSLTIEPGGTGLLGNNGAGKSTLIRSMLGQLPIEPGRVQLVGFDPARDPLQVRKRVGYMPEGDVFLPGLTGLEMVAYLGQLSGMSRSDAVSRAHEVLHTVGLGESRYREVDGYSTGMRQRIKLAGCLVHGPELLLLDEPTTGLDPVGRDEVLELVSDLVSVRELSVLISSHILPDIERTCDRVVVLNEGQLLFEGKRDDFQRADARHIHVRVKQDRQLLVEALQAAGCQVVAQPGEAGLEVELPEGTNADLIWRTARDAGLQVRQLATAADTLEQAYGRALSGGD